jgi:hypothetical protein
MAITNGISFNTGASSTAIVGDLRLAQILSMEIKNLLVDTSNLRNSPFIDYVGSIVGTGSDTIRVRKAGLDGRDSFTTATNEDDAASNTVLSDGHVDVVVNRAFLAYEITDLASFSGMGAGDIDPFRLAQSMAGSYENYFAAVTGDAIDDFTTIAGTSAAVFDVDTLLSAIFSLEQADSNRGVPGPYAAILHPKQLSEMQDSLRNESNSIFSYMPATLEAIGMKGPGYVGRFLNVDLYSSSHVNTDGTDRMGAIFGAGALGYADGVPTQLVGAVDALNLGPVAIEFNRNAATASTQIVGHAYLGMAILDDNRGVRLRSAQ